MHLHNRKANSGFTLLSQMQRVANSFRSLWRDGIRPRSVAAMLFAIVCVIVASAVRLGLGLITPDISVFASFYCATLIATLIAGAEAGCFAAGLGGVVAYVIFVPLDQDFPRFVLAQVVGVTLYLGSSVIIAWAAESYRVLLARVRNEEITRRLLSRELGHRLKNTLSNVQAIVSHSLSDQPDLRAKITSRIGALGSTNNLLLKSEWKSASFYEILISELTPYGAARFRLSGPDFRCAANPALVLTLVFHELVTNAAKYGALSVPTGQIELEWVRHKDDLILEWRERGVPVPAIPSRGGFGTKLLGRALQQFKGSIDMQFTPHGLRCKISMRLPEDVALELSGSSNEPLRPAA